MEKTFFDQPIKNKKTTDENIRKIATGQGDDNWLFIRLSIFFGYLQNDCSRFKQTTSIRC